MAAISTSLESILCVLLLLWRAGNGTMCFAALWRAVATPDPWGRETTDILVLWFVSTAVAGLVGTLLSMQLTTLIGSGATHLEAQMDPECREYHLGSARANLESVLGPHFLRHLLPMPFSPIGDGHAFPRNGRVE